MNCKIVWEILSVSFINSKLSNWHKNLVTARIVNKINDTENEIENEILGSVENNVGSRLEKIRIRKKK